MNQSVLFNDDYRFDKEQLAWCFTGQISGQLVRFFVHSSDLQRLSDLDACTKYDLEEVVELWLEKNEPEGEDVHIRL